MSDEDNTERTQYSMQQPQMTITITGPDHVVNKAYDAVVTALADEQAPPQGIIGMMSSKGSLTTELSELWEQVKYIIKEKVA